MHLGKITAPPSLLPPLLPSGPTPVDPGAASQASCLGQPPVTRYCLASLLPPFLPSSCYLSEPPPPASSARPSPPLLRRTNSWLATRPSVSAQYTFSFLAGRENRSLRGLSVEQAPNGKRVGRERPRPALPLPPLPPPLTPRPGASFLAVPLTLLEGPGRASRQQTLGL